MNTHEEYVSLETAKMLKRAGFDWEVYTYYKEDELITSYLANWSNTLLSSYISAPTQAVAMRWLREVKGLNIGLECLYDNINERINYSPTITSLQNDNYFRHRLYCEDTYEQAAEKGIQEALELLYKKDLLRRNRKCYLKD